MLHYLGYCKIGDTGAPTELLLCNSTGLNRTVEPILSRGVWGAGWYNAATVAYSDNQQNFQGNVNFDLQYNNTVWTLFRDWLVEQRVTPKSIAISPNGFGEYQYHQSPSDIRSGVWLGSAAMRIGADAIVSVDATCLALERIEQINVATNYAANLHDSQTSHSSNFLNSLDNPSPLNRNPIPGWNAQAAVTWPNAPPFWDVASQQFGMFLTETNFTVNNNAQVIRGCTGIPYPIAIVMGTISVEGDITMARDGFIPDPYGDTDTPSGFTATGASITLKLGGSASANVTMNHVLLRSDAYDIGEMNGISTRVFGYFGIGDGTLPPCQLAAFS